MQRKAKSEMGGGQRSFGSLRAELIERALSEAGGQAKRRSRHEWLPSSLTSSIPKIPHAIFPQSVPKNNKICCSLQPRRPPSGQDTPAQQPAAQRISTTGAQSRCSAGSPTSGGPRQEAESARHDLSHTLGHMHALPPNERQALVHRVHGLSGDALVNEMRMIEHALSTPNGDRAMHALAELMEYCNKGMRTTNASRQKLLMRL